jgi:hypothetical protein
LLRLNDCLKRPNYTAAMQGATLATRADCKIKIFRPPVGKRAKISTKRIPSIELN